MNERLELAHLCNEAGQMLLSPVLGDPEMEREFVRLFLSPSGAPCPPWQSVWAQEGEQARLMGAAHHSALDWYRRFGFAPSNGAEPADHAGMLLLFYAFLLGREVDEKSTEEFFQQHLTWLDRPGVALSNHSRLDCFRDLGEILIQISSRSAVLA
ncbi:MAG: molecular chaperone TorD family protein [Bryobacteraceae bacterium]|nr:molecular chaperone TorD family protein [Bryobacteraceae bacterium]